MAALPRNEQSTLRLRLKLYQSGVPQKIFLKKRISWAKFNPSIRE